MPKYNVTLVTSASTTVTVEADSPEQAREAAQEADLPTLCHQCTGGYRSGSPELVLGDDWDVPHGDLDTFVTEES